jgi:hypothetical protein
MSTVDALNLALAIGSTLAAVLVIACRILSHR